MNNGGTGAARRESPADAHRRAKSDETRGQDASPQPEPLPDNPGGSGGAGRAHGASPRPAPAGMGQILMEQPWLRRAVTVPLCLWVMWMLLSLAPIAVPLAVAADAARGRGWRWLRAYGATAWFLGHECIGLAASSGMALWHGLSKAVGVSEQVRRRQLWAGHFALQKWWIRGQWQGIERILGLQLEVDPAGPAPDLFKQKRPVLVLVRHVSWLETLLPGLLLTLPHNVLLRYMMKAPLQWDPCLDIVGNQLPNVFVSRTETGDAGKHQSTDQVSAHLCRHMGEMGLAEGVVLFPEGTRATPKRRARALRRVAEHYPELAALAGKLEHTMPPHLGGFLSVLNQLPHKDGVPQVDIIFCAHAGLDSGFLWPDLMAGKLFSEPVTVKFWTMPGETLPAEQQARGRWLYEQWLRMDQEVAQMGAGPRAANRQKAQAQSQA